MQPPWIIFSHLLILFPFSFCIGTAENLQASGKAANKVSSLVYDYEEQENYEREKRLIPYVTYYVAQTQDRNKFQPIYNSEKNTRFPVSTIQRTPANFQFDLLNQKVPDNSSKAGFDNLNIYRKYVFGLNDHIQVSEPENPYNYVAESSARFPQKKITLNPVTSLPLIQQKSTIEPQKIIEITSFTEKQNAVTPQVIKIIPVVGPPTFVNEHLNSFTARKHPILIPRTNVQTFLDQIPKSLPSSTNLSGSSQENKFPATDHKIGHNPINAVEIRPTSDPDKNSYGIGKYILATTPSSLQRNNVKHIPNISHAVRVTTPILHHITEEPPYVGKINSVAVKYQDGIRIRNPQRNHLSQGIDNVRPNQDFRENPQNGFNEARGKISLFRVPLKNEIRLVVNVAPISAEKDDKKAANTNGGPIQNSFLSTLKETNELSKDITTPNNVDRGIKTLSLILQRLQQEKQIQNVQNLLSSPVSSPKKVSRLPTDGKPENQQSFPQSSGTSTPGRPGIDYPTYSSIPPTKFDCSTQRYKGFFGDPDTNCQVWHYCDLNGGQASFLCPNGTIFSQVALTCDWWFNVKCASTSQLYVLNERLYKYILPFSPSFPEDYSGPIVDKYLTAKFNEMERKSKIKLLKLSTSTTKPKSTEEY